MSKLNLSCGHTTDSHGIVYITKEGFKAFQEWKKRYGHKRYGTVENIIKHGGAFQEKYITEVTHNDGVDICIVCLSTWKPYQ